MSNAADFHSQIASIMEVLANAAVAEICKVVDDGYAVVHLEMSRSQKENEFLRKKIKLLELQIARYRAKGAEGSASSRFPGVRLLNRHGRDSLAGPALQGRTRFVNWGSGAQQSLQKTQPIILDQDPDQDVVTTTKTESAEPEEDQDLMIVKVEGAAEMETTNNQVPIDVCISSGDDFDMTAPLPATSNSVSDGPPARCRSETEVSGSDVVTFVVLKTDETGSSSDTTCSQLGLTGRAVRAGDADATAAFPDNLRDARKDNEAALNAFKCTLSEVIVTDEKRKSDKEGEWSDVAQTKKATDRGRGGDDKTTSPTIQCVGRESAGPTSAQLTSSLQVGSARPRNTLEASSSGAGGGPGCFPQAFYQAVTMDRPFGCSSCTKRFFLESDLQKHMARHTRGKHYTCPLCGKSFVCQSQLDIHHNVHTGERPFSCSVCSRRFSHPSNLKRHQKIQH